MELSEILPLILGSAGVTAVAGSVVTALFNRRKLKADATSIISQAAGGLVEQIATDNQRLRGENAVLEARLDEMRLANERRNIRDERIKEGMRQHNEYDIELAQKLRSVGIEIADPPPLIWPTEAD